MKKNNSENRIEAYGVKGMKSVSWQKTFKSIDDLNKWADKNDAEVYGTRSAEEDFDGSIFVFDEAY